MDRIGRYKIPRPFKDEDIWFRVFTKKQLLIIGGAALISLQMIIMAYKSANSFLVFLALVLGIIFVALVSIVEKFDMPTDKYLWGGGTSLETLLMRLFRKKFRSNRVVYVRFYKGPERMEKKKWPWIQ